MNKDFAVGLCFLYSEKSLEDALIKIVNISKSKLRKLCSKSILKIPIKPKQELSVLINILNWNQIHPIFNGPTPKIIFEDDSLIVLNKPVKCHVQRQNYTDQNSLVTFLRGKYWDQKDFAVDNLGILNRLDFETSGLIFSLKNSDDYVTVKNNIHNFLQEKTYLAIVHGSLPANQLIKQFIVGYGEKSKKMKVVDQLGPGVEEACLEIKHTMYNAEKNLSLVSIILHEGHRHQIRIQLSSIGYPILGDTLYANDDAKPRLYLHAYSYKFKGKRYISDDLFDFSNYFDFNIFIQKL